MVLVNEVNEEITYITDEIGELGSILAARSTTTTTTRMMSSYLTTSREAIISTLTTNIKETRSSQSVSVEISTSILMTNKITSTIKEISSTKLPLETAVKISSRFYSPTKFIFTTTSPSMKTN